MVELTTSAATVNFASLNAAAKEAAIAQTRAFAAGLRELAPEMGAYVNEVSGGSSGCCVLEDESKLTCWKCRLRGTRRTGRKRFGGTTTPVCSRSSARSTRRMSFGARRVLGARGGTRLRIASVVFDGASESLTLWPEG